jgi:WD40 repeat protein
MSLRNRRKRFAAGFLAATLTVALISSLRHRGEPPGGDAGQGLTLAGHRYTVQALAFGRDGTRLASSSHDKTVQLWDLTTLRRAGG